MKLIHKLPLCCTGFLLTICLSSQEISQVNAGARRDLDVAIRRLADQRSTIATEKVALSRKANQAKEGASIKRRELERLNRLKDNASVGMESLREENRKLEEDLTYVSNLFQDYTREFDANIDITEKAIYQADIDLVHEANLSDDGLSLNQLTAEFRFLQTALVRLEKATGGQRFHSSTVLGPDGGVLSGSSILIGPFSFFSNDDHAGLVLADKGPPLRPRVKSLGKDHSGSIRDFLLRGGGDLPFDPTLQDALQIQYSQRSFLDEIWAGGVWIWPILLFALISFIGAAVKLVEVFTVHNPSRETLDEVLSNVQAGNDNIARDLAVQVKGPFRPLLESAIEFSRSRKELLEEVLFEKILEAQPRLERFLPFIAVTAAASPLLGLLGTVTGMISTFQQITLFGTSDASKLASGISEALVTTKFGLIAAIPALVLHALLARRVQGLLAGMEKFSTAFVNGLESKRQ
jgi:biopolymer transport protein ExbB